MSWTVLLTVAIIFLDIREGETEVVPWNLTITSSEETVLQSSFKLGASSSSPTTLSTMSMFKAITAEPIGCDSHATICSGANCLAPTSDFNATLGLVLSTVLTVMLAMVMFSMGCTVDALKLWGHIKKPWGIIIGFLCQFGIMPFTAFALSLAFNVLPVQAIVIIIMGCCPGGSGSNIICYWLDGDMDLR